MKDNLLDLIQHTSKLGVIECLKIEGTDSETKITALAEDKTVIVYGKFQNPVADFIGTFGMPNLGTLNSVLSMDEYDENATITVEKNSDDQPVNIHFNTTNNDYENDYRLMSKQLVEEKVKPVKFKGASWDIEFAPSVDSIQKLKRQSSALNNEATFTVKTVGQDIRAYLGDQSSHAGNFVFTSNVGSLKKAWSYPIKVFTSILDLPGDKTVKFSDQGVAEITVDSGISTYQYLIPAQQK